MEYMIQNTSTDILVVHISVPVTFINISLLVFALIKSPTRNILNKVFTQAKVHVLESTNQRPFD